MNTLTIRFIGNVTQVTPQTAQMVREPGTGGGMLGTVRTRVGAGVPPSIRRESPNLYLDVDKSKTSMLGHLYYQGFLRPGMDLQITENTYVNLLLSIAEFHQVSTSCIYNRDEHNDALPFARLIATSNLRDRMISPGDTARIAADFANVASDGVAEEYLDSLRRRGMNKVAGLYEELRIRLGVIAQDAGTFFVSTRIPR